MSINEKFVELDNVSFSYGSQIILQKIMLSLAQGTSYALIGKSGVGKSTLLNLFAGFVRPTQGKISINGQELKATRKNTAFLFQELGLFPWQTVTQAVAMPLHMVKGNKEVKIRDTVEDLLQEMGVSYIKDKYPNELSGGEKQRVALARTLIGKPDLLLMDEPTSSLDAMTKEAIQHLILKYQSKLKATMLFITHDIEEAVLLGEKIILLNPDTTLTIMDNPFYAVSKAKEQIGFYEKCIQIRKLMKLESDDNETNA